VDGARERRRGAATVSTGGAVSNTGIALHRLGVPTRLMGKVGDDILGRAIPDVLRSHSRVGQASSLSRTAMDKQDACPTLRHSPF